MLFRTKTAMVSEAEALAGRTDQTMPVPDAHFVNGHPLQGPWPEGYQTAVFGLGCFWGAEKLFWQTPGVWSTAVGYAGGYTPEPDLRGGVLRAHRPRRGRARRVRSRRRHASSSCSRRSGRTTTPRQGMRQGNDVGTPVPQRDLLHRRRPAGGRRGDQGDATARPSHAAGYGDITTEIAPLGDFYYAEPYHQQYLAKNPGGYCPLHATGVSCQVS